MSGSRIPEQLENVATTKMPLSVSPQDAYNWLANDFVNNFLKLTNNAYIRYYASAVSYRTHCDFCAQTAGQGFSVGATFKKRATFSSQMSNGRTASRSAEQIWTVQSGEHTSWASCRVVFKVENGDMDTTGTWKTKYFEDTIVSISFNEGEIQTSWTQVVHLDEHVLVLRTPCYMYFLCFCCLPCFLAEAYHNTATNRRKELDDASLQYAITVCAELKEKLQDALDGGTLRTLVSAMPIATSTTCVVDVVNPKEIEMSRMSKDEAEKELIELKRFLDLGIITQDDHDKKAVSLKMALLGN